ncbi:MAG: TIGR03667 family PPOX class F420-dependent oxidoreductase [Caldilineales bacterium]
MIDLNTEYGQRVARRLAEERIGWLTTVDGSGTPQPRPVWFLWQEGSLLIYSRPGTRKLEHIARSPRVALNLDGDGLGGDIVVLTGTAAVDGGAPPADQVPAYVEKYSVAMQRIGMTAEQFARVYSVAVRVTVDRLRGH